MIQDFANVFVGKQSVRYKPAPVRATVMGQKIIGAMLVGSLAVGLLVSIAFCLLIRSGLNELAAQTALKADVTKEQNGLYAKRNALLDQNTLVHAAGKLGLYTPENRQIRQL